MNEAETDIGMIPADPALRRQLMMVVIAALVLGGLYFGYLFAEIETVRSAAQPDLGGLTTQLYWMSLSLVGAAAALCVYLIVSGLRVFSSGQFPPPGTRVARDTRVRRGGRASLMATGGILLGLSVLGIAFYAHWLISHFLGIEALL